MTWQIPWVISGVEEIGVNMARVLAYVASGGAEGVVGPGDLKVSQTTSATRSVSISTGAFVCVSAFSNAPYESYIGSNTGQAELVEVPDNTSGSERYDLVYAYVTDPGAAGQGSTPYPVRLAVEIGVPASTTRISQIAALANVTGLALARIKRAGGRNAVVDAEITDLRGLANPRSITLNRFVNAENTQDNLTGSQTYPSGASWQVSVPFWATHAQIVMNGSGFALKGSNGQAIQGTSQVTLGSITTIKSKFDTSLGSAPPERLSIALATENSVPSAMRGTQQDLKLVMERTNGPATIAAVSGTNVVVSVTFVEKVGA